MHKKEIEGSLILLLAALLWGLTFIFQSQASQYIGPFTLSAFRNIVATLFLLPVMLFSIRKEEKVTKEKFNYKKAIIYGIICGLVYTIASVVQQIGIKNTSTGKAGFITALYLVLVPVFGIFLKKKIGLNIYLSVILSVVGLGLLCLKDGSFSIVTSDLYLLLCAVLFAVHIILIDSFVPHTNGIALSFFQVLTSALVSTIFMLIFEKVDLNSLLNSLVSILYCGVCSSGIGYTLQIIGQKKLNPVIASLIMSLESVFSAVGGAIIYIFYKWTSVNQFLSMQEIIGCVVMFVAVVLSLINFDTFKKRRKDNN